MCLLGQALKVLGGSFLQQHEEYCTPVAALLLGHVLLLPGSRKLALIALKALKRQSMPPLTGDGCHLVLCVFQQW